MSSLDPSVPNPALYQATSPASGGTKRRISSTDLMILLKRVSAFPIRNS